jgi:predicted P-loop ATPase
MAPWQDTLARLWQKKYFLRTLPPSHFCMEVTKTKKIFSLLRGRHSDRSEKKIKESLAPLQRWSDRTEKEKKGSACAAAADRTAPNKISGARADNAVQKRPKKFVRAPWHCMHCWMK